jgi:hypothetical protein
VSGGPGMMTALPGVKSITVVAVLVLAFSGALLADTFVVTQTGDSGPGSLRQAIMDANGRAGLDTIAFSIPGAGVHTITPVTPLPSITDAVVIDGYTQPGTSTNTLATGDNGVLLIELSGASAGASNGITISAANCVVRGLVINRFTVSFSVGGRGIFITANSATIEGCFIGIDATGTSALGNTNDGIVIQSANNTIGGTTVASRNIISSNSGTGIRLSGGTATGNVIEGNYIGTNRSGTAALGNGIDGGVSLEGASSNTVGGTSAAGRNVISGNNGNGVRLTADQSGSTSASGNTVLGNYIGTNAAGTGAIPNSGRGIRLGDNTSAGAPNNTIGGTATGAGNVISGNTQDGIELLGSGTNHNNIVIQGNIIGLTADGSTALGNFRGIQSASSANLTVGGTVAGARNVISSNTREGLVMQFATGTVQGNFIGTDITGQLNRGNGFEGLQLSGSQTNSTIGGTSAAARNVISGNTREGITVLDPGTTNNTIQGNYIGVAADGTTALGNAKDGILLNSGTNIAIGGTATGAGNIIANNGLDGVDVGSGVQGNPILSNSIYNNGTTSLHLGIDLVPSDGVNANDLGDGDTGSNNQQNFPVITSATNDGTNTTIAGTLNSTANGAFRLEFFSNSVRDASGFGQGENFIGASGVTTNGNGNASFNSSFPQVNDGQWITATATDSNGNTSEFSASIAVTGPVILNTTTVTARNGQPFKFRVLTAGGNPTQRLSVTGLPPGLSANAVTGIISGTPTTDGGYNVLVTVTDGAITLQGTLWITIASDPGLPVIVSPSVVTVPRGQSFSYKIDAPANTTSSDRTTFSIAGTLPAGLSFNGGTGVISGTLVVVKSAHSGPGEVKALSGGTLLGIIQMFATNSHGTATSPLALLQLPPMAVNISTRLPVGTGENVLIAGFIVTGNAPKIVIIRGIGPSLNGSGLQGVLQDPQLELRNGAGVLLIANDNWRSHQETEINETTIPPTNDLESAIVALLDPGSYTAILRGTNNSTGIAVVESYDLGTASMDVGSGAQLANISTRGFVNTSDNVMIGGIISANGSAKFIIRAIGPSLSGSGIQGVLQDPTLELRSSNGTLLSSNDNWKTRPDGSSQQAEIEATTIPPKNDLESALVQTVAPGNYTAIVRGKNNMTGVGVVEVYNLQ